jgi:hypothetical protein
MHLPPSHSDLDADANYTALTPRPRLSSPFCVHPIASPKVTRCWPSHCYGGRLGIAAAAGVSVLAHGSQGIPRDHIAQVCCAIRSRGQPSVPNTPPWGMTPLAGFTRFLLSQDSIAGCSRRIHSQAAPAGFNHWLLPPDSLACCCCRIHSLRALPDSITSCSRRTDSLAALDGLSSKLLWPDSLACCSRRIHSLAALAGFNHWLLPPESLAYFSCRIQSRAPLAGFTRLLLSPD